METIRKSRIDTIDQNRSRLDRSLEFLLGEVLQYRCNQLHWIICTYFVYHNDYSIFFPLIVRLL